MPELVSKNTVCEMIGEIIVCERVLSDKVIIACFNIRIKIKAFKVAGRKIFKTDFLIVFQLYEVFGTQGSCTGNVRKFFMLNEGIYEVFFVLIC